MQSEKSGVMGGLRERSEEEMRSAGREELVSALKEEWDNRDKVSPAVILTGSCVVRAERTAVDRMVKVQSV